ncbi:MAG: hypothetical protein WBM07_01620 [Chitinivibrionales bacterium]
MGMQPNEYIPKKKLQNPRKPTKRRRPKSELISPELLKLVEGLQKLPNQAYSAYAPLVEDVIRKKSRDTQEIEHLLDGILDFCFDATMLTLFKKLCRYYYFIDPEAAAAQVYAFREMWDEKSLRKDKS